MKISDEFLYSGQTKEEQEEQEKLRQDAIKQAEKERRDKYKKQEDEREDMRQTIRDKVWNSYCNLQRKSRFPFPLRSIFMVILVNDQ